MKQVSLTRAHLDFPVGLDLCLALKTEGQKGFFLLSKLRQTFPNQFLMTIIVYHYKYNCSHHFTGLRLSKLLNLLNLAKCISQN